MGYKMITEEKIFEVFRRWHGRQKISHISQAEELDRKTIRDYLHHFINNGYTQEQPFPPRQELYAFINTIMPERERKKSQAEKLIPYIDDIKTLIHDEKEPVLPKTAYEIIITRHNLDVSYTTFKRFIKENKIKKKPKSFSLNIELPPGRETQIDYGKVGLLPDAETGKNKTVYAYCGILSHSRFPYIEFTFSQNQQSFTQSTVNMFEFYGGTPEFISIDNLKSGVIKPDLYEPTLNHAFSEMAQYYDVFINPCRVATPTDKGKVERMVPSARELFRKLKKLHPSANIHELNKLSKQWCRDEYGMREHGTTHQQPLMVFEDYEKDVLQHLPAERFTIPAWKKATVRPDQFFSYDKKIFSLPPKYAGEEVWIRQTGPVLQVFHKHILIREYIFSNKFRNFEPGDFPETLREMMDGSYPKYLIKQAQVYGEIPQHLIESVLKPHAYLNARRAQGMLRVMEEYHTKTFFLDVCRKAINRQVKTPKTFKQMLNHEDDQLTLDSTVPMSKEGSSMVRDIKDIIN
ncbi:MAG: IS21 family transposase [bacterium]|nr:IS21 family transposase [bacterium]